MLLTLSITTKSALEVLNSSGHTKLINMHMKLFAYDGAFDSSTNQNSALRSIAFDEVGRPIPLLNNY